LISDDETDLFIAYVDFMPPHIHKISQPFCSDRIPKSSAEMNWYFGRTFKTTCQFSQQFLVLRVLRFIEDLRVLIFVFIKRLK
jgi:hypothetical protein